MLSKRLRPNIEAAPWVIEEIEKLEKSLVSASVELSKESGAANELKKTLTAQIPGYSVFKLEEFETVGELIDQLSHYPRDKELGFRNQPRQTLHEVHHVDGVHLCFQ